MLTVNSAFYRSSREVAFSLQLTHPQIRRLLDVQKDIKRKNQMREHNRKVQELREQLNKANLHCPDEPMLDDATVPEFVDEGDGTTPFCTIPVNPTERVLVDKGLVTGWKRHMVLTRAGYLTLQLLQVSGHIQEFGFAAKKLSELTGQP